MVELILLCVVMIVPTVLALLLIEYCADSRLRYQTEVYLRAVAGYGWKDLSSRDRTHRAVESDQGPLPTVDETFATDPHARVREHWAPTAEPASPAPQDRPGAMRHAS